MTAPRPRLFGFTFAFNVSYYYIVIGSVLGLGLFAKNLTRSKVGRAFVAIRDNDIAAEVLGINVFGYKLLAFAVGTFYAGVAGALLGHLYMWANVEAFTLWDSFWLVAMLIVGGLGSHVGAVFGVIFFSLLNEGITALGPKLAVLLPFLGDQTTTALTLVGGSLIMILFMLYEPRGLAHKWELFKANYRLTPFSY